jgi:drug/metabolite transporter (DMT)-like permease
MGEVLALAAAVAFAFGTVLQQKGTLSTRSEGDNPRFLLEILRKPVWLAGAVCQGAGWVLQAAALDRASLLIVQSLTSLSLVVALPLGVWLTDQRIGRREILGGTFTFIGIVLFLSAGQPHGGTSHPSAGVWWAACLGTLFLVVALAVLSKRLRGAERAISLGVGAGLAFGLQAAVTKTFVGLVGSGFLNLVTSWSVYVLIVTAIVGFGLQQSALKTGLLAPAIAASNSVTLFSSIVLGITVYGESLSKSGGAHIGSAVLGLATAIAGIVLLARSAPQQLSPSGTMAESG